MQSLKGSAAGLSRRHMVTGALGAVVLPMAALVFGKKLKGTTLYTSGESCPMCMGAIVWCGIARVVYGASIAQLATKMGQIMITDAEIADKTPFVDITLTGGVLAEESLKLFK